MKTTFIALVVVAISCTTAGAQPATGPSTRPFLGLRVRDDPAVGTLIVSSVFPGPLQPGEEKSAMLARGDLVTAVNGKALTSKQLHDLLETLNAGDQVTLKVVRTKGDPKSAVPTTGPAREEKEITVTLPSIADWSGPIHFPPMEGAVNPDPVIGPLPDMPLQPFITAQLDAQKLREPVDKLLKLFEQTQRDDMGANSLPRVSYAFYHPMRLPQLQRMMTSGLPALAGDPRQVLIQSADNLAVPEKPKLSDAADLSDPKAAVAYMKDRLAAAQGHLDAALGKIDSDTRKMLALGMPDLMANLAGHDSPGEEKEPRRLIRVMQASMQIDYGALLAAAGDLSGLMLPSKLPPADAAKVELPQAIKAAVTGDVLAFEQTPQGAIVYGGPGANTYDMTKLAVVIDAGGDDVYKYSDDAPQRPAIQVIVDFAGNDKYLGEKSAGPASALLGVSLVVDYAGNDHYAGGDRSCGVGAMGIGILLDRAGNDIYEGASWSEGAAFYGCGAILDLGGGGDIYLADVNSQACGGPRGFGLILDDNGEDFYRANGPTPSAYEQPGIYYGMSQGVGIGMRNYDSGGIGILEDLGGNDRYEAGEFSQGGGYYWGLGILNDRNGNDLYFGHRYSQGYGCHQAMGVLCDENGDDTYYAMTAANQGGAWDVGMGMLLDMSGNDAYSAGGLSQGGAAQQGIAWLLDLAGTDHYIAPRSSTHGQSGSNQYRYHASGCWSWSLFIDAGGTQDFYSTERTNGQTLATGKLNAEKPELSDLHGLFIDTAEKVELVK